LNSVSGNRCFLFPKDNLRHCTANWRWWCPPIRSCFFTEFRPERKIKIPVFFNLPTESKQFIVNGQLINEKADPSFGTGLQFRILRLKVDSESLLDFDFGPLLTCIVGGNNDVSFAPILAGRIRVKRGENFVMYIGTSYTLGLDVFGLFYGTGTVF